MPNSNQTRKGPIRPGDFLVTFFASLWTTFVLVGFFAHVQAETLRLRSGEMLEGKLNHYFENQLTFTLNNGEIKKIPRDEIQSMEFGLDTAGPEITTAPKTSTSTKEKPGTFLDTLGERTSKFKTPLDTFLTWRSAAVEGDIDKMTDCYAAFQQKEVRKKLKKLSKKDRKEMQETTAGAEFVPAKPFYQGDRAMLEVNWKTGLHNDTQVLQFVLEKNEWKLVQQ